MSWCVERVGGCENGKRLGVAESPEQDGTVCHANQDSGLAQGRLRKGVKGVWVTQAQRISSSCLQPHRKPQRLSPRLRGASPSTCTQVRLNKQPARRRRQRQPTRQRQRHTMTKQPRIRSDTMIRVKQDAQTTSGLEMCVCVLCSLVKLVVS